MTLPYNRGMELNFKNAVILSMIIHAVIILSLPVFKAERIKHNKIIIDYIPSVEPKKTEITRQETRAMSVDTPKINLAPKVEMKPAASVSPETSAARQKEILNELAMKQARIKSTKDYISYYQLIREKIRQKLKNKYRSYYNEGDVCLVFVLRSDGALLSAAADPERSVRDRTLIDTAVQSLKEAAPFAPFPKALTLPQMSFTLTVSFKK